MTTYVQTSGDFDKLDPVARFEAQQELLAFLDRERPRLHNLHLHAHIKRLNAALGSNVLLRCTLNLAAGRLRFRVVEEGFGPEAAVKNAILALRYQVEKQLEIMIEQREKAEGRHAFMAET
jgi:hypothetical protein